MKSKYTEAVEFISGLLWIPILIYFMIQDIPVRILMAILGISSFVAMCIFVAEFNGDNG